MKTLAVLWLLLTVVGVTIMLWRMFMRPVEAATCQYTASRALPASFRLQDGDWGNALADVPSISGKYTDRAYDKGGFLCGGQMLSTPLIVSGDANPVLLNVPAGPLNAGAIVDIYRNKKMAARQVPVLAILCGAKDCSYVVVGVKKDDLPAVTEGEASPVLLIRQLP